MAKPMNKVCAPEEVALKNFFLGPQAENGEWVSDLVSTVLREWFRWRKTVFPTDGTAIPEHDRSSASSRAARASFEKLLDELMRRFADEVPKFSPRYVGHMFSEVSLPALFGHFVTLLHNPNNVSGDSSRVGMVIEDEAVSSLLTMIGMDPKSGFGHFTSGGTVANFEALVRARNRQWKWLLAGAQGRMQRKFKGDIVEAAHMGWQKFDNLKMTDSGDSLETLGLIEASRYLSEAFAESYREPVLIVPNHRHYSWPKGMKVLGFGTKSIWPVKLDGAGRLKIDDLNDTIERAISESRPILGVISVAGTTELGQIDPVHQVVESLRRWANRGVHIWHHSDAAYGGFFASLLTPERRVLDFPVLNELRGLRDCDSVTLDPHKLGYVPYSSGTFLCRDQRDYHLQSIDAPYLRFATDQERGPQTLEGSRSAAGAVATWLTARAIGLNAGGYGRILLRTIENRIELESLLRRLPDVRVAPGCETNVLAFTVARQSEALSESNARVDRIRRNFSTSGEGKFFVSGTRLGIEAYGTFVNDFLHTWNAKVDSDGVDLVRMVLMNPFFSTKEASISFIDEFVRELEKALKE